MFLLGQQRISVVASVIAVRDSLLVPPQAIFESVIGSNNPMIAISRPIDPLAFEYDLKISPYARPTTVTSVPNNNIAIAAQHLLERFC
jgi:hypothetical protein